MTYFRLLFQIWYSPSLTQLVLQVFHQWCVVFPVLQSSTQLRTMLWDRLVNEYKAENRQSSIFTKSGFLYFKFSERGVPVFSIAIHLSKLFF